MRNKATRLNHLTNGPKIFSTNIKKDALQKCFLLRRRKAEEAGLLFLAHQIYATYRRLDITHLNTMLNRAKEYSEVIEEAASAYDVDVDLLMGIQLHF